MSLAASSSFFFWKRGKKNNINVKHSRVRTVVKRISYEKAKSNEILRYGVTKKWTDEWVNEWMCERVSEWMVTVTYHYGKGFQNQNSSSRFMRRAAFPRWTAIESLWKKKQLHDPNYMTFSSRQHYSLKQWGSLVFVIISTGVAAFFEAPVLEFRANKITTVHFVDGIFCSTAHISKRPG